MHIPTLLEKPRTTHLQWRQAKEASVITPSNICGLCRATTQCKDSTFPVSKPTALGGSPAFLPTPYPWGIFSLLFSSPTSSSLLFSLLPPPVPQTLRLSAAPPCTAPDAPWRPRAPCSRPLHWAGCSPAAAGHAGPGDPPPEPARLTASQEAVIEIDASLGAMAGARRRP